MQALGCGTGEKGDKPDRGVVQKGEHTTKEKYCRDHMPRSYLLLHTDALR